MSSPLGSLSVLKYDNLISLLLEFSVKELLTIEQVCKRFREIVHDNVLWAAKLHNLPREQWPLIGPYETQAGSNLRQIVLDAIKASRNWATGSSSLTKRLHHTGHQDDYLSVLPGGQYVLTASTRVITCVDALACAEHQIVFDYIFPSLSLASIHQIGYDMTSVDTVLITVVVVHDDTYQRCIFIRLNLKDRTHTFLHNSDQYQDMVILPENWIVNAVIVKEDWVCLHMKWRWRNPSDHAVFICNVNDMSGLFLRRVKHSRYKKPDQVALSEGHSHLILLMEVPAVLSLPTSRLADLWGKRQPNGEWTLNNLDYGLCDQEVTLPKADHVLRSGHTALSTNFMEEMAREVRGKHSARRLDARKPTWLDLNRVKLRTGGKSVALTLVDTRTYSLVSNRVAQYLLYFIVDAQDARFILEQESSLFSNEEPEHMLGPMSRQGHFVVYQKYIPFASKIAMDRLQQCRLHNNMRASRSWDIDYYCANLAFIDKDNDGRYIVNYESYS